MPTGLDNLERLQKMLNGELISREEFSRLNDELFQVPPESAEAVDEGPDSPEPSSDPTTLSASIGSEQKRQGGVIRIKSSLWEPVGSPRKPSPSLSIALWSPTTSDPGFFSPSIILATRIRPVRSPPRSSGRSWGCRRSRKTGWIVCNSDRSSRESPTIFVDAFYQEKVFANDLYPAW